MAFMVKNYRLKNAKGRVLCKGLSTMEEAIKCQKALGDGEDEIVIQEGFETDDEVEMSDDEVVMSDDGEEYVEMSDDDEEYVEMSDDEEFQVA